VSGVEIRAARPADVEAIARIHTHRSVSSLFVKS